MLRVSNLPQKLTLLKTWSERPQERCNVCALQYQHHQEFWTNCGKTHGFLAYSTCSLDVNLRKNAETRAWNGAFSSNSLLFAVYLHLWSTSALFFFFFYLSGRFCLHNLPRLAKTYEHPTKLGMTKVVLSGSWGCWRRKTDRGPP